MSSSTVSTLERLRNLDPPSVLIVDNGMEKTARLLADSLVRNTTSDIDSVVLVETAGGDALEPVLDIEPRHVDVHVVASTGHLSDDLNTALGLTVNDVVLLDAQSEVPPRWLEQLKLAAYRDERVGAVLALSDVQACEDFPWNLPRDDLARMVTRHSHRLLPGVTSSLRPLCLYLKRRLLEEIGPFRRDIDHPDGGQGDLLDRATAAGWSVVLDDSTLVLRHPPSARPRAGSTPAAEKLHVQQMPATNSSVEQSVQAVRSACRAAAVLTGPVRTRILHIVEAGTPPASQRAFDVASALLDAYESFVLTSDGRRLSLYALDGSGLVLMNEQRFEIPLSFSDMTSAEYRSAFARTCLENSIELVHIHDLFRHTLDVPRVAADLELPVVVSLQDYYLSCPTRTLLDDRGSFCGGRCTPGQGVCPVPHWVTPPAHLKHGWVHAWRRHVQESLDAVDAFVAPSDFARSVHLESHPALSRRPFEVIQSGCDLESPPLRSAPQPDEAIKILLIGELDRAGGAAVVRRLKRLDAAGLLEFHFLGRVADDLRSLGIDHGPVDAKHIARQVARIQPSVVGLFSPVAEPYSHELSQAWRMSIPVIANDDGATRDLVARHGGGWLVDLEDDEATYEVLVELSRQPEGYARVATQVSPRNVRSVAETARDHDRLYRSVAARRRTFSSTRGRALPLLNLFVLGDRGKHPGSVHVRTLRRYFHPLIQRQLSARLEPVEDFLAESSPADLVLVQRTAIPPDQSTSFLDQLDARGIPLALDLDDHLLAAGDDPVLEAEYGPHIESLRQIVGASALVTVSTEPLRDALAGHAERVEVVANMLDESLWLRDLERRRQCAARIHDPVQLIYVGTATHGRDLLILRQVLPLLRSEFGLNVELNVIGGEPEDEGQEWYRRIPIPPEKTNYPGFVTWLAGLRNGWDIAVAPLADVEFNRYKSDLKFLEYSALGLPGVYSAIGPYGATVEAGRTGMLADARSEDWADQLAALVSDADLRSSVASSALDLVVEDRVLAASASRDTATILSIL